ncbi:MAG: DegV family EDD domain-containing protein [Myxococcales bacterium]|nr:DegV family EDD domain-containing protein [Myxococcales bacterium]
MRILTNPGSNIGDDLAHSLDVDLTPQKIVVDGISHDTRNAMDLTQVDRWVKNASQHPFVQGTTEVEFTEHFTRLAKKDPEILAVMTSRQIIGSHDAAVAAAAALKSAADPALEAAKIEVVDTTVTDVGAGLVTMAAVQARKAGLSLQDTAKFCRAFALAGRSVISVATLENLIKGGRASFLQGWVANFLNVRPLLSFDNGKPVSVARVSAKADPAEKLDEWMGERLDKGRAVWLGIAHGDVEDKAKALLARLKDRYQVEFSMVRALSPSIYLHVGRGGLALFIYPLDGLPHRPAAPSV